MIIQTSCALRAAICAGILLLVFFSAEAAFVGRVVVEVTGSNGKPVAGAVVELWSVVPGPPRSETRYDEKTTPQNGTLEFTQVKAGTYLVRVLCPNGDYLPTDDEDHDFTISNKTIYQRFTCDTSGGAGGGKVNTDKKARTTPDGSTKVVQTGDWQPGDEVSFSFTGTVSGPSDGNQPQDDYTDTFVGIVDQQGNKTEIPWSKLIKYTVPALATVVTATLMKPDRTIISTAHIPVNPKGTKLPIQLPPKTTGNTVAYPVHQIGQPYTVYSPGGRFSGDANKIILLTTNKIDGATTGSNAVAASPRSALFNLRVKNPGSYKYAIIDEGKFEDSFDVSAVGIKLDTSRAYRVKQQGTLAIIVALPPQADAQQKLFSENFHVTIKMETPNVLAFSNGQIEVVWPLQKSEVTNNQARKEFPVRAGTPGAFKITARAKTPRCSNPMMTTAKTGERVVMSGSNVYFRPDDPAPSDDCEKLKKDAADALKLAQDKEIEAGRLLVEAERLKGLIKNAEEGGPAYWKDKADQLENEAKILEDSAEQLINEPAKKQQKQRNQANAANKKREARGLKAKAEAAKKIAQELEKENVPAGTVARPGQGQTSENAEARSRMEQHAKDKINEANRLKKEAQELRAKENDLRKEYDECKKKSR